MSNSQTPTSIKAIDDRSVHQICSGQVILSLATAVKELVENSIDANATNVEVRLRDFGIESIEVHDNGDGIQEKDHEALGLKHYTSKLREFSDLAIVDTFGFRGEALSSLCALSKLTIVTRHSSKDVGSKLEFDYDGKLTSKKPCARDKGTTVVVNHLFQSLPVRHKEFQRNIKKEFSKLNTILQAYGLISSGVKLSCVNCTEKNKKNVILSTPGSGGLSENMASIFGPKQVRSLLDFSQQSPDEDVLEHFNISPKDAKSNAGLFAITGFISRAEHGCGRSSMDRQFYFVNKRPCDLLKVSRLVNEVYHMFNRNQYPFVVLDISTQSDCIDVNVTPDKRQLFIQNEKLLWAILKASLLKMFTDTAGQYRLNDKHADNMSSVVNSPNALAQKESNSYAVESKQSFSEGEQHYDNSRDSSINGHNSAASKILTKFKNRFGRQEVKDSSHDKDNHVCAAVQTGMERFTYKLSENSPNHSERSFIELSLGNSAVDKVSRSSSEEKNIDCYEEESSSNSVSSNASVNYKTPNETGALEVSMHGSKPDVAEKTIAERAIEEPSVKQNLIVPSLSPTDSLSSIELIDLEDGDLKGYAKEVPKQQTRKAEKRKTADYCNQRTRHTPQQTKRPRLSNTKIFTHRKEVSISFDMSDLRRKLSSSQCNDKQDCSDMELRGFAAKISPSQNNDAEDELRRNITKDMFREMEILGQFNLGFIIAKLGDDLFIIDQHATDEKYNFECLQRDHCLKGQKLIHPKPLELTAVGESVLIDNIEIFRKNGFDFLIDESQCATQKVKLVALPTSKNWTFDVEDIDELIFMLTDSPGVVCRPSRVRSMFASRACRMSTMVGSPLNRFQMKKLVSHMGDIEHPWNCPHGRPTMRHLINIKRIDVNSSKDP
eukprot:gene19017-20929_t